MPSSLLQPHARSGQGAGHAPHCALRPVPGRAGVRAAALPSATLRVVNVFPTCKLAWCKVAPCCVWLLHRSLLLSVWLPLWPTSAYKSPVTIHTVVRLHACNHISGWLRLNQATQSGCSIRLAPPQSGCTGTSADAPSPCRSRRLRAGCATPAACAPCRQAAPASVDRWREVGSDLRFLSLAHVHGEDRQRWQRPANATLERATRCTCRQNPT